jgi:hypothetical protein
VGEIVRQQKKNGGRNLHKGRTGLEQLLAAGGSLLVASSLASRLPVSP